MRRVFYGLGLVTAFVGGAMFLNRADAAPPVATNPAVAPSEVGRFQIQNGSPAAMSTIMLIDTVTGDSWVYCVGDEGKLWCRLPKSSNTAGVPSKP